MILVDDRTGSAELAPLLTTPSHITRLEYADFSFIGNGPHGPVSVGVERKTIMDLISSIASGRLSGHQMIGLIDNYDWVYLLVEGQWRVDARTGDLFRKILITNRWVKVRLGKRTFKGFAIYNFLNTVRVMCDILIVRVNTPKETAQWLDGVYKWWGKPWEAHKSHSQFQVRQKHVGLVKPSLVARVAKEFSGVGWDKAKVIAEEIMSVGMLAEATVEDLMNVGGIGKVLANSIYKEVRRDG